MQKPAQTSVPILEVLANRWSPRAYDAEHQLSDAEVLAILEAGRWAPSANNFQPWFFSMIRRDDEKFAAICERALEGFNAAWAPKASALLAISISTVNADGNPRKVSLYDAGLAAMSMVIQAESMGLATHQIGGFKKDELSQVLGIATNDIEPVILITLGKAAEPTTLEGPAYEREIAPRSRKSLDEIVLHGKP